MKKEEIINTLKMAIAEVEWEYPMDYTVAFEETIKLLNTDVFQILYDNCMKYSECSKCPFYTDKCYLRKAPCDWDINYIKEKVNYPDL